MPRSIRCSIIIIAIATICGCGGSDSTKPSGGTPCGITLSGDAVGSRDCAAFTGTYVTQTDLGTVAIGTDHSMSVTVNSLPMSALLYISISFPGDLHTGTFRHSDANAAGNVGVNTGPESPCWSAAAGTSDDMGSYTLTITSVGTATTVQTGKTYSNVHGTLVAVLPPMCFMTADTVRMSATF